MQWSFIQVKPKCTVSCITFGGREACRARTKAVAAGKPVGRARKRRRLGSLQGAHESGGGREACRARTKAAAAGK
ncbi:MAG: hypothetical protein WCY59_01075, partial [Anaerovoracaceae bacterium]